MFLILAVCDALGVGEQARAVLALMVLIGWIIVTRSGRRETDGN